MKNPRFNFTLCEYDANLLKLICAKRKITVSHFVRRVVEDWLHNYRKLNEKDGEL